MDHKKMLDMVHNVPTLSNKLNFAATSVSDFLGGVAGGILVDFLFLLKGLWVWGAWGGGWGGMGRWVPFSSLLARLNQNYPLFFSNSSTKLSNYLLKYTHLQPIYYLSPPHAPNLLTSFFQTGSGAILRARFLGLCVLPFLFLVDLNGGIVNGGFTKSKLKYDIKAKPDYMTNQLFVVHRQEMPDMMWVKWRGGGRGRGEKMKFTDQMRQWLPVNTL